MKPPLTSCSARFPVLRLYKGRIRAAVDLCLSLLPARRLHPFLVSMIFKPNNTDIDFAELESKIQRTVEYRRNATRLAGGHGMRVQANGAPQLDWRQRVRSWPVAGPLIARLYHRVRMMLVPG